MSLSIPEIRRLLVISWRRTPSVRHALRWSRWRRIHQFRAHLAHIRLQQRLFPYLRL